MPKSLLMETPECQVCRSVDPIILHNIPHRGVFASLCTACVLRHHPGSFCPICFDLYEDKRPPTPTHSRIMCLRCPAMAHLTCLPATRSSTALRYLCPHCSDPSFSFFNFGPPASNGGSTIVFTRDLAKQLLCAAKIAAVSMQKAAAMARADAEQKVRGALLARQKAREAIERVACLMANQRTRDDESDVDDG